MNEKDILAFEGMLDRIVHMPGIAFNEHDAAWVQMYTSNILRWYLHLPTYRSPLMNPPLPHEYNNPDRVCKCGHWEHGSQEPYCMTRGCECLIYRPKQLNILGD